ncbi:hypothetical protein HN512_04380 [Candidatus Peregrinibacteria bacterium]|jgi:hypothetical protein|nr:hypothetical protein [Candidatus Peregrinibacteria bacterium]MBT3599045.1 hypothetical protein [Candidatus Peregrinibacteria bacterium]MBT4366937.1 hypothetical protein [Candidatus Peregrinibacteria bacterium]MBT4586276.1 hypothetical protein [Candidatus Peregrinibacteria bacterium]MBT6730649.1 hypothetical protein [Candidatus Peregrinibacteria bacterium]
MPRGKRTVFGMFCTETGARLGTIRLHKQDKKGVSFKEHAKKLKKYSPRVRKIVKVKIKEERHS